MEATQRMSASEDDFPDNESEDENSRIQYGILRILSQDKVDLESPREFKVFGGETMIGRDPDQCNIVIDNKTLSRVHAILDIDDVTSMTIHDNHSLNKTLRNGIQLKPDVHYAIEGGETITLGEIEMKFELLAKDDDTAEGTNGATATASPTNDFHTVEYGKCLVPETPASKSRGFKDSIMHTSSPLVKTNGDEAKDQSTIPDSPESSNASRIENQSLDDSSFLAPSQPALPRPGRAFSVTETVQERTVKVPMERHIFEAEAQQVGNIYDMDTQIVEDEPVTEAPKNDKSIFMLETQDIMRDNRDGLHEKSTTKTATNNSMQEKQSSAGDVARKSPSLFPDDVIEAEEESERTIRNPTLEPENVHTSMKDKDIISCAKPMEDEDLFFAETQPYEEEKEEENISKVAEETDLNSSTTSENLLDQSTSPQCSPMHSSPIPVESNPVVIAEESDTSVSEAPTQLMNDTSNELSENDIGINCTTGQDDAEVTCGIATTAENLENARIIKSSSEALESSTMMNVVESDDEIIASSQDSTTDKTNFTCTSMELTKSASNCTAYKKQLSNNLHGNELAQSLKPVGQTVAEETRPVMESQDQPHNSTEISNSSSIKPALNEEPAVNKYLSFKKKIVRRSKEEQKDTKHSGGSPVSAIVDTDTVWEMSPVDSEDDDHSGQEQDSEPLILPSTQSLLGETNQAAYDSDCEEFEEANVDFAPTSKAGLNTEEVSSGDEAKLVIDESSDRPKRSNQANRKMSRGKEAARPIEKQARRQPRSNNKVVASSDVTIKVEDQTKTENKMPVQVKKADNSIACANTEASSSAEIPEEKEHIPVPVKSEQLIKSAHGTDIRRSSRQIKRSSRLLETYDTSPSKSRKLTTTSASPSKSKKITAGSKLMQNYVDQKASTSTSNDLAKQEKSASAKREVGKSLLERREQKVFLMVESNTELNDVSGGCTMNHNILQQPTMSSISNLDNDSVADDCAGQKNEPKVKEQLRGESEQEPVKSHIALPMPEKLSKNTKGKAKLSKVLNKIGIEQATRNSGVDQSGSENNARMSLSSFPVKINESPQKLSVESRKIRDKVCQSPKNSAKKRNETGLSLKSTSPKSDKVKTPILKHDLKTSPTTNATNLRPGREGKTAIGEKATLAASKRYTQPLPCESLAVNEIEAAKIPTSIATLMLEVGSNMQAQADAKQVLPGSSRKRISYGATKVSEPSMSIRNRRRREVKIEDSGDSSKKRYKEVDDCSEALNSNKASGKSPVEAPQVPVEGSNRISRKRPVKSESPKKHANERNDNASVSESPRKKPKKGDEIKASKNDNKNGQNLAGTKNSTFAHPEGRTRRPKRNESVTNANCTAEYSPDANKLLELKEPTEISLRTPRRGSSKTDFSSGNVQQKKTNRKTEVNHQGKTPQNGSTETVEAVPSSRRRTRRGESTVLVENSVGPSVRSTVRKASTNSLDSSVSSTTSTSSSGRRKLHPAVMFTGIDKPQDKKIVTDLGGLVTDSLEDCTVLVTDKIRRTAKFLCMVGKGVPIVSPTWLIMSKETKCFQDPWKHIIADEESEKKWGFNLRTTLRNSAKSPLLSDLKVFVTRSVVPSLEQFKEMVEFAGGEWLKTLPRKPADNVLVISCPEDKKLLTAPIKQGVKIFDKEILLTGLLKKELDEKTHLLQL